MFRSKYFWWLPNQIFEETEGWHVPSELCLNDLLCLKTHIAVHFTLEIHAQKQHKGYI